MSTDHMPAGCANGPSPQPVVRETSFVSRDSPIVDLNEIRFTIHVSRMSRTPPAACFRILHPLVVFGINDVQPGRTTGGQQLFVCADDRQPERLQFQG